MQHGRAPSMAAAASYPGPIPIQSGLHFNRTSLITLFISIAYFIWGCIFYVTGTILPRQKV